MDIIQVFIRIVNTYNELSSTSNFHSWMMAEFAAWHPNVQQFCRAHQIERNPWLRIHPHPAKPGGYAAQTRSPSGN